MILGVESSCDETALALVRFGREVIAEGVSSQIEDHRPYGGVVPELAARKHLEVLTTLFDQLIDRAATRGAKEPGAILSQIDGVAVSVGPGLLGSLLVGGEFAKACALALGKPLIRVDHVLAHFHGAFLSMRLKGQTPDFPALGYVISGGHTHLFELHDETHFELIAQTIDDACGECFDKVGKMLGLDYPGGPRVEKLACDGDPERYPMPRMMVRASGLNLSYSGLKTYVANFIKEIQREDHLGGKSGDEDRVGEENHEENQNKKRDWRADLAASFQREAFDQLRRKLITAYKLRPECRQIYVCGGVASNMALRTMLKSWAGSASLPITFAEPRWCTDNAAMIASMGHYLQLSAVGLEISGQDSFLPPYSRFTPPRVSSLFSVQAHKN